MAHIQERLTAILRSHRTSPSADVKVNTVRMYGKATDMPTASVNALNTSDKVSISLIF